MAQQLTNHWRIKRPYFRPREAPNTVCSHHNAPSSSAHTHTHTHAGVELRFVGRRSLWLHCGLPTKPHSHVFSGSILGPFPAWRFCCSFPRTHGRTTAAHCKWQDPAEPTHCAFHFVLTLLSLVLASRTSASCLSWPFCSEPACCYRNARSCSHSFLFSLLLLLLFFLFSFFLFSFFLTALSLSSTSPTSPPPPPLPPHDPPLLDNRCPICPPTGQHLARLLISRPSRLVWCLFWRNHSTAGFGCCSSSLWRPDGQSVLFCTRASSFLVFGFYSRLPSTFLDDLWPSS